MHVVSESRGEWDRPGTVRGIRKFGDPVLRESCATVTDFDARLESLIADMFATMYSVDGIGLAANQIGVALRVFVFDCPDNQGGWHRGYMVNPTRTFVGEEEPDDSEGCLSIPGVYAEFPRSSQVVCEGQDMTGAKIRIEGEAYFARCLLHETQHLEGKLFVDVLEGDTRRDALKAIRKSSFTSQ
ncbi:peptide deformylase [Phytohabitans flavus]|uniref:Peptide deformylase n=1 Tax=Phytohabitans flavus TaxID=1076124 RepID=A0A6F8XIP6_9ACTN|nr:peptide deformylase [Phytohabitans flavus]BCB73668.1 peptide deformylase 4 [Phytohabitans flavus]